MTVTVEAAASGAVTPTWRAAGAAAAPFNFSYTFTGLTTYAGKNIIGLAFQQGGTAPTLTFGGEAMTLRGSVGSGNNQMHLYDVTPAAPG